MSSKEKYFKGVFCNILELSCERKFSLKVRDTSFFQEEEWTHTQVGTTVTRLAYFVKVLLTSSLKKAAQIFDDFWVCIFKAYVGKF